MEDWHTWQWIDFNYQEHMEPSEGQQQRNTVTTTESHQCYNVIHSNIQMRKPGHSHEPGRYTRLMSFLGCFLYIYSRMYPVTPIRSDSRAEKTRVRSDSNKRRHISVACFENILVLVCPLFLTWIEVFPQISGKTSISLPFHCWFCCWTNLP